MNYVKTFDSRDKYLETSIRDWLNSLPRSIVIRLERLPMNQVLVIASDISSVIRSVTVQIGVDQAEATSEPDATLVGGTIIGIVPKTEGDSTYGVVRATLNGDGSVTVRIIEPVGVDIATYDVAVMVV